MKLIEIATKELGVTELAGKSHNERILEYSEDLGFDVVEDETPWCSIFMSWVAKKAGYKYSKSLDARSWRTVGLPVSDPEPGDIVIYWRESRYSWKGHVGIFMGFSKDQSRIYTLGGNQQNSVSISAYRAEQLIGFRRLTKPSDLELPHKFLGVGDSGRDVQKIQEALKLLSFNVGTTDGFFGPKTEAAVKQLQSTNHNIEINGTYDEMTKKYLEELLR